MPQKKKLNQIRKESTYVPQHDEDNSMCTPLPATSTSSERAEAGMADEKGERTACATGDDSHGLTQEEYPDAESSDGAEPEIQIKAADATRKHPLSRANIISKIFFCWMFKFFRVGYRKPLEDDDLYDVLPQDSTRVLVEALDREWQLELEKNKRTGERPSLRRAIWRTFGWGYMVLGVPAFFEECVFKVVQPLMMSRLVLYFSTDQVPTGQAYLLAAGVCLAASMTMVCHHVAFFGVARYGMRIRVACSGLIYRKALRLSNLALGETTIGQLVNILSNDVNRFDLAFIFLHYLWIAPIQLILVTALIWREIGISCLAGMPILILLAPLQGYMAKLFSRFRSKTALLSDARIRIMNEVIAGMRVIKIYAWEPSFAKLVSEARRKEIRKIMHAAYLRSFTLAFFFVAPLLITFCTFLVYSALGNAVVPSKVYAVIPLFYAARLCSALFVPFAIMNGTEGLVSVRRIKNFLLMEELGVDTTMTDASTPSEVPDGMAIQLNHVDVAADDDCASLVPAEDSDCPQQQTASTDQSVESPTPSTAFLNHTGETLVQENKTRFLFDLNAETHTSGILVDKLRGSWTKDMSNAVLEGISFRVEPGELLAVIGPVGCGKSSLLMALLGELPTVAGVNAVSGRVGYTAQQPWILTGSLRDNILFGSEYKPAKYRQVIRQCALTRDIELLSDGDQTLVGERGVTLSGGQRARVSLARAVYSDADVYLLDDPLSAVDPAVGRHLFSKCILNYLSRKPRILVTHQLQFLDKADKILVLKQGKVADYGTYQQLQEQGIDFSALLRKKSEDRDYDEDVEEEMLPRLERQLSVMSRTSLCSSIPDFDIEEPPNVVPEETAVGTVGVSVYLRYFKAGANVLLLLFWLIMVLGAQAVFSLSEWWLSQWAYAEEQNLAAQNLTSQYDDSFVQFENRTFYIQPYAIMCSVTFVTCFIRSFLFFHIFVTAASCLHNQMFRSIIRAPMQFFDTNPVGRVLNRFAKDIGFMDELLPATFTDFLQIMVLTVSTVIVISVFNPFCLTFTVPIFIVFIFTRRYYLASSRAVKRLESNARSPVFSHLSATLNGLSTVRAFRAQRRFTTEFDEYQDKHTRAWFLFLATSRWFGVQLDSFSVLFICGVSFTSVVAINYLELNSGIVGLSLTYAINLMGAFQWGVRQSAEVENQMTSVERVCQYVDVKSEAPLETDHKPPSDWPKYGLITLEGTSLSYTEDGPEVLKKIYCCFRSKEKVGIVGRTGAGKSSLMTVLMRLAEPTGTIMIDGINTALIGLHDLRKKVSFIPQDPVLFSGSLRRNLDPFDNHSDMDIWRALEEVELKPAVEELPDKLEAVLTEGGTNFSVGQRQLLCLARAILRKNKILIVDEATANVDVRTDRLIQATIRQRFKHCTVLTIAHRLNTIMDSDRVLVLDAGRLIEFDEPYILLQKEGGAFTEMVKEMGKAEMAKLQEVAREKYRERNPSDPYGLFDPERRSTSPIRRYTSPTGRRTVSIETSL
ncbi:LOW QUALITY PROTEIN: multidrug resistance-associated protein 4-like [Acanthaster planci]|uniref:Cystic fibrosis transmembrane conductance regulator n=1 Tax=Acanthaster planci TaxID=133434 RepID=A0A8B7YJH3_ACAPL|nr:LOW QUALITY PROTEIN: multidrug resistance-associated protein 4-like [Acanthaster planci]